MLTIRSTTDLRGPRHPWLRLFRAPNLFTVPGDALAGFALGARGFTAGWSALIAGGAVLLFYMAGLALNDLVDHKEDADQRPDRPLVTGEIKRYQAIWASILLTEIGLFCCLLLGKHVLLLGICLAGSIAVYNMLSKNIPGLGAVNMGLCRGLSLLLGAYAGSGTSFLPTGVISAAILLAAFIAAVTLLARHEDAPAHVALPVAEAWLPAIVLVFGYTYLFWHMPMPATGERVLFSLAAMATLGCALVAAVRITRVTTTDTTSIMGQDMREALLQMLPGQIGGLISALLFFQASLIIVADWGRAGIMLSLGLVLMWPLSRWMARRIPAS